ncbi:MAG: acyl-CoA/acyl-ACP dehydrogenase [Deltaproteobacteria bacterium]|nr:acyl-CoA/acyl-ACP dehydrogenase [Deltaproteobacteria bacterium]
MNFAFSQEQEMLREAARRFLADNCPATRVRRAMADPTGHDPELWQKLVELGWPGLLIPERYGGQGGNFLDMTVVVEEAGKALLPGPFFTAALTGAPALLDGAPEPLKQELLPRSARGDYICTVAVAEAGGRLDAEGVELRPARQGRDWVLSGEKFFVPDAHLANGIVVAARTARKAEQGITLFLVDVPSPGLTITQLKTVDMTRRCCHLSFDNVVVPSSRILGKRHEGWPILRRMLEVATSALATELVGVAQRALDLSVEYARTRVQFGRPIGSFQAVKHKCVDMLVQVENARSLAYYAAWTVDERAPDSAAAVAMAKAYASEMAVNVTSDAIQVHGGIGFTWEHDMHLYHRRALAGEASLGDARSHRETVARSILD